MKRMLMAGNWKMHKLTGETRGLVEDLKARLSNVDQPVEVLLCPTFTSLGAAVLAAQGSKIKIGAQNMHWENEGAFTGEISAAMVKDIGCEYVIIGHSERRHVFGETDEETNKKTLAALDAGLKPILCVGETEGERDSGETEAVVSRQVRRGLDGVDSAGIAAVVIAYEPVWAIGTGKTATPDQAQQVHALIRKLVLEGFGEAAASALLILYGGSVKPANADELMAQADINGALIGGAALDADSFEKIVRAGVEASG